MIWAFRPHWGLLGSFENGLDATDLQTGQAAEEDDHVREPMVVVGSRQLFNRVLRHEAVMGSQGTECLSFPVCGSAPAHRTTISPANKWHGAKATSAHT